MKIHLFLFSKKLHKYVMNFFLNLQNFRKKVKFFLILIMTKFVRPSSLEFPQIYSTFMAKDRDSDELVEYRIQDIPEEDYERAVDFMLKNYIPDENLSVCRDIESDLAAMTEMREFWTNKVNLKVSVACYKNNDESNEIIGVNMLAVESKDDESHIDKKVNKT